MADLLQLKTLAESCTGCPLAKTRTHVVFGEGNPDADIMFVGEGPGASEDEQGRPFVGAAGQLLDKILASVHLAREEVYIANVVKCRPPANRVPTDAEAQACLNYLRRQVVAIHPKIIVCLGTTACKHLIHPDAKVSAVHGQFYHKGGYYFYATYHPAALLRDSSKKIDVWFDMQKLREAYDKLRKGEDIL